MKLKKDIHNLMNRNKIYAHAGDEVKLIGTVIVMAIKDGAKFSVRADDLEEFVKDPPVNDPPKAETNVEVQGKKDKPFSGASQKTKPAPTPMPPSTPTLF